MYASVNYGIIGSDNGLALIGSKPLSDPVLTGCQLELWNQPSVKYESKYNNFHARRILWNGCLQNGGHFCLGFKMLNASESLLLRWFPVFVNFHHFFQNQRNTVYLLHIMSIFDMCLSYNDTCQIGTWFMSSNRYLDKWRSTNGEYQKELQ